MPSGRSILSAIVLAALLLGLTAPGAAPDDDAGEQLVKLKAAYLRTLSRYVEWPGTTFADEKAALVICVVGTDPFGAILDQSVRDATARGRPFEIRRLRKLPQESAPPAAHDAATADLRRCHVLFLCESERTEIVRIRTMLLGAHVLTVSDIPEFARDGGVIELVLDEGKVRFHINRRAAERAGLRIDAKFMSLARKVYEEDR
jgi:hypothetical protein